MPEQDDPQRRAGVQTVLQWAQLLVLVIGVGGLFLTIGRRDAMLEMNGQQISELRAICSDLARVTGSLSSTDATHSAQIASIEKRLDRLERQP
jgi:hypothetical protein